jgi:hypothetical protein
MPESKALSPGLAEGGSGGKAHGCCVASRSTAAAALYSAKCRIKRRAITSSNTSAHAWDATSQPALVLSPWPSSDSATLDGLRESADASSSLAAVHQLCRVCAEQEEVCLVQSAREWARVPRRVQLLGHPLAHIQDCGIDRSLQAQEKGRVVVPEGRLVLVETDRMLGRTP